VRVRNPNPSCQITNCEFNSGQAGAIGWIIIPDRFHHSSVGLIRPTLMIDNCVYMGHEAISVQHAPMLMSQINFRRCTAAGSLVVGVTVGPPNRGRCLELQAIDCVFDTKYLVGDSRQQPQRQRRMQDLITWSDQGCLFDVEHYLGQSSPEQIEREIPEEDWEDFLNDFESSYTMAAVDDLEAWNTLWQQQDTGSVALSIKLAGVGGNVRPIGKEITRDDYRIVGLTNVTVGQLDEERAFDKVGADVDRIGPGKAYEAWRGSDAFKAWRERIQIFLPSSP